MSNDNEEHERNKRIAKDLASQIRKALQGDDRVPPNLVPIMERDNRGILTDVANDYDLFLGEIQASKGLLTPAIGYVGHVMTTMRETMCNLLRPTDDSYLHELVAPAVIGYEEHGGDGIMMTPQGIELLDLALISCLATARGVVLNRIRKFCGTADMLESLKPGEGGPGVEFATSVLESIQRILRLLDAIGVQFADRDQSRFDLCQATVKIEKFIADRSK